CEKRRFRSLLVHRTATDHHLAERRLIHDPRFRWRRRPFRRVKLFHVVHEIKSDRFRRARIEGGEYARLAIGVDYRRLLETGIARELRHVLRTLGIAAVLRRDRYLPDSILQSLHGLFMPLRD